MLAGTAFAGAGVLNVSFVCFCPETCLSGHDNIPVVGALRQVGRKRTSNWYCVPGIGVPVTSNMHTATVRRRCPCDSPRWVIDARLGSL